jgi:predicted nucleic acid binding AN1-type Zn finger protein
MTTPVAPNNSPYLSSATSALQNISTMTLSTSSDSVSATANAKKRCGHAECKKKLTLLDFDCKCGARFCGAHRAAEDHACTFNYRAAADARLSTTLVKTAGDRLADRI